MNYRRKNSDRFTVWVWVVVLLVAGLMTWQWFQPSVLPSLGHSLATPIWRLEIGVRDQTADLLAGFRSKQTLQEENRRLNRALIRAETELLYSRVLADELQRLRQAMEYRQPETLLATVLADPSRLPYNHLVIDRGSRDGLTVNDPVLVGDRVVIGQIKAIYQETATVQLFTAADNELTGQLFPAQAPVTMKGLGSGFFFEVTRDIEVEEGDLVLLPETDRLIAAEIVQVETPEGGAFHRVWARLPVDLGNLRYVSVLKGERIDFSAPEPAE